MTRFPYDQFAKDYLKELLENLGEVKTDRKVPAEIREIDVYFAPSPHPPERAVELGLLGRFAAKAGLFEAFRNAVQPLEVCSCMGKLFYTFAELERKNNRDKTRLSLEDLPFLWILSPTASPSLLNGFNTQLDEENWGAGIYFLGDHIKTAIIAIHQLPSTPETLWLRLLGKGGVQQRAIDELEALSPDNPLRSKAIDLLLNLRTTLELTQGIDEEDRGLIMSLSPIYEQKLAEVREQGIQQGLEQGLEQGLQQGRRGVIENLLRLKFGSLDEELSVIIEPLLTLTPEEFTPLLIQLTRSELLSRFNQW